MAWGRAVAWAGRHPKLRRRSPRPRAGRADAGRAGKAFALPARPWSGQRSPLNYYVPGLVSYAWAAMTLTTTRTGRRPEGRRVAWLEPEGSGRVGDPPDH